MMCMFSLIILVGIGFYAAIGVGGMMVSSDTTVRDSLEDVCDEFIPEVEATLEQQQENIDNANSQMSIYPQSSPMYQQYERDRDTAQFEIDQALIAIGILETMCDCMVNIFDELAKFTGPGLVCAFLCFCLFILNCCACCCIKR